MADRRYGLMTMPNQLDYRKTNSKMKTGKCYNLCTCSWDAAESETNVYIYQSSPIVDQRIKMDHRCTVHVYIPT